MALDQIALVAVIERTSLASQAMTRLGRLTPTCPQIGRQIGKLVAAPGAFRHQHRFYQAGARFYQAGAFVRFPIRD